MYVCWVLGAKGGGNHVVPTFWLLLQGEREAIKPKHSNNSNIFGGDSSSQKIVCRGKMLPKVRKDLGSTIYQLCLLVANKPVLAQGNVKRLS